MYVFTLLRTKKVTFVVCFDEVPLSVSGRMSHATTIVEVGAPDVRIKQDDIDNKRAGTTLLGVGVFLRERFAACKVFQIPPYLLLRGEPKRASILAELYDKGIVVGWTPKG